MSCISAPDPQLERLASAIAQRVGPQRFHVWFDNSTRLDLRHDGLEIAVPNDFISEWITRNFTGPIQDAAQEVLGAPLEVRFTVVPQLFESGRNGNARSSANGNGNGNGNGHGSAGSNGRGNGNGNGSGNGHGAAAAAAAASGRPFAMTATPGGRLTVGLLGEVPSDAALHEASALVAASRMRAPAPAAKSPVLREVAGGGVPAAAESARPVRTGSPAVGAAPALGYSAPARLRHDLASFVVGPGNQLAHTAATAVADEPGSQYNPLFIHGACGLGKTHLLQGLCRRFLENHPTKRWMYLTGEEFTNDFLSAMRSNKLDAFRRRMRELDLLVIDDVHFLGGKKHTQEEFLHTFNAIEALGRQVVLASDEHPKMIHEFGESLINRFVSGMVVRIDPPNQATRCEILRRLAARHGITLSDDVVAWVARRVTQNVRELEGAVTRINAHVKLSGRSPDLAMVQESLGDLERQLVAPVKPENVLDAVCAYFGLEMRDLMSGRRQRTISLARSVAMHLIRKTAKLSFPEIGMRMGKRNHSTVISACRRMERACEKNETLLWSSSIGEREEEACELVQRLEELSRAMN